MSERLHVTAIYLSLGDAVFFEASLRSVYDHVDRVIVVTTYDRDWQGASREPDELVDMVLSRRFDPDGKVDLLVVRETSEARARNRAMDYALAAGASGRVRQQHEHDHPPPPVDYFLIVDPDEVYEAADLDRLLAFAARRRLPLYRVGAWRYFKRWNNRVAGLEWSTALVRADVRLTYLRNRYVPMWRRVGSRLPVLPASWRTRIRREQDVPGDVAVFHHGSYVGPRDRVAEKLASFGHAHEVAPGWLERMWDGWTPAARNFHPVWPELYASAEVIATPDLPAEIRAVQWPAEFID